MTDPIVLAAADWIHASECDCKEGPHTSHIAVAVDIISEVKPPIRAHALREAAKKWRGWTPGGCPTCEADPMLRETVGMVCQTCGHDYYANDRGQQ